MFIGSTIGRGAEEVEGTGSGAGFGRLNLLAVGTDGLVVRGGIKSSSSSEIEMAVGLTTGHGAAAVDVEGAGSGRGIDVAL